MWKLVQSLLVGALVVLFSLGSAAAADEKAVAGVAEFVAATTVEVRKWKAARVCDTSAMRATATQCRSQADTLNAAADKATPAMKQPLAALENNLRALEKEIPHSRDRRCRGEWIAIVGCHAELDLIAASLGHLLDAK